MSVSEVGGSEAWPVERLQAENQALRERLERREQELLASNRMMAKVLNQSVARSESLEKRTQQLEAIGAVAQALAGVIEPAQVMEMALGQALEVLGQSIASIYLLDGGELVLQAHRGFTAEMVAQMGRLKLGQALAGKVAQDGEPRLTPDLSAEKGLDIPTTGHLRSAAVVPLKWQGQTIGTMAVASSTVGGLAPEDLNCLVGLAGSVAFFTVNARQVAQLRERIEELSLLTDLSRIISSSLTIEPVYDSFVSALKGIADIARAALVLVEGDHFRIVALCSEVEAPLGRQDIVSAKGSPGEQLAATGQTLYQPDLAQQRHLWPDDLFLRVGLRCNIRIPLIQQAKFIGYVTLHSKLPHAYDDPRLRRLLEEAVGLLAPAVAHQQLFQRLGQPAGGQG